MENIKSVVEALIFASDTPIDVNKICQIIGNGNNPESIKKVIEDLNQEYFESGRAFHVEKISGGYCLTTRKDYSHFIKQLYMDKLKNRLSRSAMECLAIISIKQPITRVEIEKIRGVNSAGSISTLMEKELITIRGKKKVAGNPILYGTTDLFLKILGLSSLEDLPDYQEIRQFVEEQAKKQERQEMIEGTEEANEDIKEGNNEIQNK